LVLLIIDLKYVVSVDKTGLEAKKIAFALQCEGETMGWAN